MKLISVLLLCGGLAVFAETEERITKRFDAQPGGKLIVDVDFGSVEVKAGQSSEITIDVLRKVKRGDKASEEAFLKERPVAFDQNGNTLTIRSRSQRQNSGLSWRGIRRAEGHYTVVVPTEFDAQVRTSGGSISVAELKGDVNARTSDGSLKLVKLRGSLDAHTSGGSIRVTECQGPISVNTSGGSIDIQDAVGKLTAATSGGSVSAKFAAPLAEDVMLRTSGGNVTLRVPDKSAFDLDAVTSGGNVSSDLPVQTEGKPKRTQLKGPVNGGGKSVVLRTSGGNIQVKKI